MSDLNRIDVAGLHSDDDDRKASESKSNETSVSRQTEQKPKSKGGNSNQTERKASIAGSSNYSRVILKRNKSYDSKSDNQAFDEKQRDEDRPSYEWFETQMNRVGKKTDTHSGANFQNLMVNLAAKKVTQPPTSVADTDNILEFEQANQSFCDTIDRYFPNCNFINFQLCENDGNGGETRRNGIAAQLYDETGRPMIQQIITDLYWHAKVQMESLIDQACNSQGWFPVTYLSIRGTLPKGTLSMTMATFMKFVRNAYTTMVDRVKNDKTIGLSQETIDEVHTSYNKSVHDAYHKLPQGCWEDMVDCETNFIVDLNDPQMALTVDTQSLIKFRLEHMVKRSPMASQLHREMRYVRLALRKHLKHLNDPTIHQKLSDGSATNPTEFFFQLGFTGMGILKRAEDHLWRSLGQNLKLVKTHHKMLTDQWNKVVDMKVGFADTLRKCTNRPSRWFRSTTHSTSYLKTGQSNHHQDGHTKESVSVLQKSSTNALKRLNLSAQSTLTLYTKISSPFDNGISSHLRRLEPCRVRTNKYGKLNS